MREIDRLHLKYPYMGARMLRNTLTLQGDRIGCRDPQHFVYPYLLRDITLAKSNHVWCADITYIAMERGFLYLFAVMDWATRRILAWRLSNCLTADFCIDAVESADENRGVVRRVIHFEIGIRHSDIQSHLWHPLLDRVLVLPQVAQKRRY